MNQGLSVVIAAILVAGAVLVSGAGNKSRYHIIGSDSPLMFRLDTFTGSITACMMDPSGYQTAYGGVRIGDSRFLVSCGDPSASAQ